VSTYVPSLPGKCEVCGMHEWCRRDTKEKPLGCEADDHDKRTGRTFDPTMPCNYPLNVCEECRAGHA
jgi:hypothetical protein